MSAALLPALRVSGPGLMLDSVAPTRLDRVISYFSPQAGVRRMRARVAMALSGVHTGARTDRRATAAWSTVSASPDADNNADLPTLRERSRDLVRNAPLATGAIRTNVTNVVGTGLKLKATPDRRVLGLSVEQANEWARTTERWFRLWAESTGCDATATQKFAQLQALVFRTVLTSGDCLALRRFVERPGDVFGLRLQVIEGDRLSNPNGNLDRDGLSAGVELDTDGAPIAYHVANRYPIDIGFRMPDRWFRLPAFSVSGERLALHVFDRERPNQTRGLPYLSPVIESLKQIDRYTEAELMAAVVASLFTVFIKSEEDSEAENLDGGGGTVTNTDTDIAMGHGAVVGLGENESIETANPNRPNATFDPFVVAILRQIGVALELPFELLIKHFTASYSASRAALLEAWKFWRGRRKFLVDSFCSPVYRWWLFEAVARGIIRAPGFLEDPFVRAAWLDAEWYGDGQGQLDPLKETNAALRRVEGGLSTLAEETAALTGGVWETKHDQRELEHRRRVEAGLEPGAASSDSKADAPTREPDDEDDEEERER